MLTYRISGSGAGQYITVTGRDAGSPELRIPETMEGLPVLEIASHAFENDATVESVHLPPSLEMVGSFAFYNCPALREIRFSDSIGSFGLGAIRSSERLADLIFRADRGRYSVLISLLEDVEIALTVHVFMPEGEACFHFPAYVRGFQEDTRARAFHSFIEGQGVAYRETVTRKGVDIRSYDRLFPRAAGDSWQVAAPIALARLRWPWRLSPQAESQYRTYLLEMSPDILPGLISQGRREDVLFLAEQALFTSEAASRSLAEATRRGDAEIVSLLMDTKKDQPPEAEVFSLDDW